MSGTLQIAGREVGPGQPVFVVAELSANHLHDLDRAHALVEAAAQAGADAIKLQTYTPQTITLDHPGERFRIGPGTPWSGRRLAEVYADAMTPWEWHAQLASAAQERGMVWFSSPFDASAVEFLEELDVPAHKIASFELVDSDLIARAARTGKPVILSTGMATLEEIEVAVAALRAAGGTQLALLKCTSSYPAPPESMNLRAMGTLAQHFDVPVGLSDHTLDTTAVVSAVALGASIVEKHICIARDDGGPDAGFSLEPHEFAETVRAIRRTEAALGRATLAPTEAEKELRRFRRSLFVVADVRAGELFDEANVRSIRPADGLEPKELPRVLGRSATRDVKRGTPLSWDLLE